MYLQFKKIHSIKAFFKNTVPYDRAKNEMGCFKYCQSKVVSRIIKLFFISSGWFWHFYEVVFYLLSFESTVQLFVDVTVFIGCGGGGLQ